MTTSLPPTPSQTVGPFFELGLLQPPRPVLVQVMGYTDHAVS